MATYFEIIILEVPRFLSDLTYYMTVKALKITYFSSAEKVTKVSLLTVW